jgi:hypothetical protein
MLHEFVEKGNANGMPTDVSVTLIVDPRFPGGTSSAVAREIDALVGVTDLRIVAFDSNMFKGRETNQRLAKILEKHGLEIEWDVSLVRDEIVVFHNPSCLKFNKELPLRIVCDQLFVVAHENFLQPGGREGFDVGLCMGSLEKASLSRVKFLAPVSDYTRENIASWLIGRDHISDWHMSQKDWINICDFDLCPVSPTPGDRRGRMSRPGFEKFPSTEIMQRHFPEHAECCMILGGNSLLLDPESVPDHWNVMPFGAMEVDEFLSNIDFFVYFTHPNLRESFGRVVAEAVAAGKLVITEPGLAKSFDGMVVPSDGDDVDEIVEGFLSSPHEYRKFVQTAQKRLARFNADAFLRNTFDNFEHGRISRA